MKSPSNVFIFSDKIGVGKTSLLLDWTKDKSNVGGILTPKINTIRHFLSIQSKEHRKVEVEVSDVTIGRYYFDNQAFLWAENEFLNQNNQDLEWMVLDEVGPLEMKKKLGFHQLIVKILEEKKTKKTKYIFVVRDFLVSEFLLKYKIKNPQILPKNYFYNQQLDPLTGVVLCGGESKRMQTDKALLYYSKVPQWKNSYDLLLPFCKEVVLSINENQYQTWAKKENNHLVIDSPKFEKKGPISGIRSVLEQNDHQGIFILAVDYPFLKTEHLLSLFNERTPDFEAVCYEKQGFIEPLITILEKSAIQKLIDFFEKGNSSIKEFLEQIKTKKILGKHTDFLQNMNTKEAFNSIIKTGE